MKKTKLLLICCLTAALFLLLSLSALAAGNALGDVDGNGKVESADARLALRASVGLEKYAKGNAAFTAADADQDGKITSADARLILRASVGLENLIDFGTMLEDQQKFRIGIDFWQWDVSQDGYSYVDVYMAVQNRSNQYEEIFLGNWAVNDCMTGDWDRIDDNAYFLAPGEVRYQIYRIWDSETPEDFNLAPTGQIAFTYEVYTVVDPYSNNADYTFIDRGTHVVYDTGKTQYAHYRPSYSDDFYDIANDDIQFTYLAYDYEYNSNWAALDNYFLIRNRTDRKLFVSIVVTAVNGIPIPDGSLSRSYIDLTVYGQHSALLDDVLYYDFVDTGAGYTEALNSVGVLPKDVKNLTYTVTVYDEKSDTILLKQDTWVSLS